MTTGSTIFLPLNPTDPSSDTISFNSFADGYVNGVGFGLSCSSARIEELCSLIALFPGTLMFHDPASNAFLPKAEDRFMDYLAGDCDDEETYERLAKLTESAMEQVERGELPAALSSKLARIPLAEKIALHWACDAKILSAREAEQACLRGGSGAERLLIEGRAAAHRLLKTIIGPFDEDENGMNIEFSPSYCYFWRQGRFWIEAEMGEQEVSVPLIQVCALQRRQGPHGNFSAYLGIITDHDKSDLLALIDELESRELPWADLFDGQCEAALTALVEKARLDTALPQRAPSLQSGAIKRPRAI